MKCNFELIEVGKYKCAVCGLEVSKSYRSECRPRQEKSPSFIQKVVNFVPAAISHAVKGNPTVSDEVLQQRLKICRNCPLYKDLGNNEGMCTHSSCGCPIKDKLEYRNKIAWADQACPIGSWDKEKGV